ncbi:MAG: TetR/AcrR family transcriptional regulator [Sphingomonadaceae bacterium]|nr:TetR/AcrR family transcriptional regulator [Sphingomonadaceae bacterium]
MANGNTGAQRPASGPARDGRRPTPQVERRALSEGRIIASALRIIAEKGVQGMTLADAGERAGYSRGLPAHLFGSRAELMRQCALSLSEQVWQDTMPVRDADSALEAIEGAVTAWIDLLQARPAFARAYYLMAAESLRDTDQPEPFALVVRDFSNRGQARFATIIADGVAAGEFASAVDAQAESWLIHATLRGIGMQWLLRPDLIDLPLLTGALTENLRRHILTR